MKNIDISEISHNKIKIVYFAKACVIPFIITLLALLIISIITLFSQVDYQGAYIALFVISVLCMFIAGFMASKVSGTRGWLNGAIAGLVYTVLPTLIAMLALDSFYLGLNTVIMLAVGFITGAMGGIVGINIRSKRK